MRKALLPLLLAAVLAFSACGKTAPPADGSSAPEPTTDISPVESIKGTPVSVIYKGAGLTLTLPEGWTYEEWNRFPEEASFGLDFRPADASGSITLGYSDFFGVCGTGLRTEDLTLNDGSAASVGYYDGKTDWDYVYFKDAPQAFSAFNNGLSGEALAEALKILQTAVFLPVSLTDSQQTDWTKSAEYSYGYAGIQLTMPDDWDYSVTPYQPDGFRFTLTLHAPYNGGDVIIRSDRYYDEWQDSFEDYITMPGGWGPATVYYHDDPDMPYAVYFNNAPGFYYAFIRLSDKTQYETALEILRQIRFTKGEVSRKTAETLVCDFADITGELKCSYDISTGCWTVQELSSKDNTLLREFFVSQDCTVTQRGN